MFDNNVCIGYCRCHVGNAGYGRVDDFLLCLSGFQVRQGSMYVHVVEQKVLEKYVCNNRDEIIPKTCRKVLVTDLFANAAPVGQIDLRLKDAVAQLVSKFVETHKSNPPVWDNLGLIQSARLQLQVKSEMQRQRKHMQLKTKKRKEEIEKKVKRAREAMQAENKLKKNYNKNLSLRLASGNVNVNAKRPNANENRKW